MTEENKKSALQFHGTWVDFFKIAIVNLLLCIITLAIYRFWAATREREYLWTETEFIDERLEWTGAGMELFIGAIIQDSLAVAITIILGLILLIYFLIGVAYFRALSYRLGRIYWRGIRGGSDAADFKYGLLNIWPNIWPIFEKMSWAPFRSIFWGHIAIGTFLLRTWKLMAK